MRFGSDSGQPPTGDDPNAASTPAQVLQFPVIRPVEGAREPLLIDFPAAQAPDSPTEEPGLAIAEVSRQLGVASPTLRTWDRRYGLSPSVRTAGAHRRYTATDIARIQLMRTLTLEGLAPADAARIALLTPEKELDIEPILPTPGRQSAPDERQNLDKARSEPSADKGGAQNERPVLRVLPGLPPDSPAFRIEAAVDAALEFNLSGCIDALSFARDEADPTRWWVEIARPALTALAERVVLSLPGESPITIAETATHRALDDYLHRYDAERANLGLPTMRHPARLNKLVLILGDPGHPETPAAHALAAGLIIGGAAARVVTGSLSPRRLGELLNLTKPAALILTYGAARTPGFIEEIRSHLPDIPVFIDLPKGSEPLSFDNATAIHQISSFEALKSQTLAIL